MFIREASKPSPPIFVARARALVCLPNITEHNEEKTYMTKYMNNQYCDTTHINNLYRTHTQTELLFTYIKIFSVHIIVYFYRICFLRARALFVYVFDDKTLISKLIISKIFRFATVGRPEI